MPSDLAKNQLSLPYHGGSAMTQEEKRIKLAEALDCV
jgi:hypothetical protein